MFLTILNMALIALAVFITIDSGLSPLALVIRCRSQFFTEKLIERGYDVNGKDIFGHPPLNAAARTSVAAVHHLIEKGAKVDSVEGGDTALHHIALSNKHVAAAEALLERGARVDVESKGLQPLHIAARHAQAEMVQVFLAHGANVNAVDHNGATPLHHLLMFQSAIAHDGTVSLGLLIAAGADVNAKHPEEGTPLQMAVRHNLIRSVRFLLTHKAEVEAGIDCSDLVRQQNSEQQQTKDASSSDKNEAASCGSTPLLLATMNGNEAIMNLLLLKGNAEVNRRSGEHLLTPLVAAVHKDKPAPIVLLLLQRGADVSHKVNGMTALDLALQRNNLGLAKVLSTWNVEHRPALE